MLYTILASYLLFVVGINDTLSDVLMSEMMIFSVMLCDTVTMIQAAPGPGAASLAPVRSPCRLYVHNVNLSQYTMSMSD